MKTVNLALKVQVPDETPDAVVARAVDKALDGKDWHDAPECCDWKVGKTVITRPRVDRTKGR